MSSISHAVTDWLNQQGVYAVFLLMALDALLPAAGELVMLYAGALASGALAAEVTLFGDPLSSGIETFMVLSIAGTVGYLVGSWIGWGIGRFGGRPFLERRGRWLHLSEERLAKAQRWFDRHGASTIFIGRLVPGVRSFVSVPAGAFGRPLGLYTLLTLAASAVWCFGFAGLGWALGSSWERAHKAFEVSVVVGAVLVAIGGITWLVLRRRNRGAQAG
jgi:membrane protein DedA with SNARE-associated domain